MERRAEVTPEQRIAQGNATIERFNRRLLQLAGVVALLLLVLMGLTLLRLTGIAQDTRRSVMAAEVEAAAAKQQAEQVADLLARQKRADSERSKVIDAAIVEINRGQLDALADHDIRTKEAIARALGLLEQEVNAPANMERRAPSAPAPPAAASAPAPFPAPPAAAPRREPAPAPRPAPPPAPPRVAPAPAPVAPAPVQPPPCETRGKSKKCR